ncbi:MAG TPA: copper amine oxidase N-terminal domain-containing protein [Armatimonadaceae bacterium]|nr:copper amine oxidase N-terminal domain-containing protein [Armatimonadaceae bacterium]
MNTKTRIYTLAGLTATFLSAAGSGAGWAQSATGAKGGAPAAATHQVMVNGRPVDGDVSPHFMDGTLMIPLRFVTEYLGGKANWNDQTKVATLHYQTRVMQFRHEDPSGTVNGEGRALSKAPFILRGRILLPLRDVARFYNAQVTYNPNSRVTFIKTPSGSVEPPIRQPEVPIKLPNPSL